MFIMYLHTKFHMPISYHELITTMKQNAKYRFNVIAMLFYMLQRNYLNKSWNFVKVIYHTKCLDSEDIKWYMCCSNPTSLHGCHADIIDGRK
jgi:hypothetical protein